MTSKNNLYYAEKYKRKRPHELSKKKSLYKKNYYILKKTILIKKEKPRKGTIKTRTGVCERTRTGVCLQTRTGV